MNDDVRTPGVEAPPTAAYSDEDRERFAEEAPKSNARTHFQRDRARVLHSSTLRRLGAKTQVLGAGANDFVRTRLTHSLEVAQVGRDLGQALGCDPDIVDAACLSHDLGHPPFGHHGEQVLDELAADIGGFEGNAQTFRLLTRLEPKVGTAAEPRGLNLTRAVLDATTKYPWARGGGPDPDSSKFGCYADDAPTFEWMRAAGPTGPAGDLPGAAPRPRRCIEAQIMDVSDDIAYSVHDIEDAVEGRALDLARLRDEPMEREAALYVARDWYFPSVTGVDRLEAALERLEAQPFWLAALGQDYRSRAALKDLTSQLVGRFTRAVVVGTRAAFEGTLSRYAGDVVVPADIADEINVLKGLAAAYVMTSEVQRRVYAEQDEILRDLFHEYCRTEDYRLDPFFAEQWRLAPDDAARVRVVVDQIASLTDVSARRQHARLKGLGLPSAADRPLF
jgi:dGTPase